MANPLPNHRQYDEDNEPNIETEFLELLRKQLDVPEVSHIQTFEDAGLLTHDEGLCLRYKGRTIQLTIVER